MKTRAEIDAEVERIIAATRAVNVNHIGDLVRGAVKALPNNHLRQKFVIAVGVMATLLVAAKKKEAKQQAELVRAIVATRPSLDQALAHLDKRRDDDPNFWRAERYDPTRAAIVAHYRGGALH